MEDLMSNAFDGMWGNTAKQKKKSDYDEAMEFFWKESKYVKPKEYNASKGSNYVRDVKPVKMREDVIEANARVQKLKAEYNRRLLEDKIRDLNTRRTERNIKTLKTAVRTAAYTGNQLGSAASKSIRKAYITGAPILKKASISAGDFLRKKLSEMKAKEQQTEPVGLGGAIYKSNKAAGKKSIYD